MYPRLRPVGARRAAATAEVRSGRARDKSATAWPRRRSAAALPARLPLIRPPRPAAAAAGARLSGGGGRGAGRPRQRCPRRARGNGGAGAAGTDKAAIVPARPAPGRCRGGGPRPSPTAGRGAVSPDPVLARERPRGPKPPSVLGRPWRSGAGGGGGGRFAEGSPAALARQRFCFQPTSEIFRMKPLRLLDEILQLFREKSFTFWIKYSRLGTEFFCWKLYFHGNCWQRMKGIFFPSLLKKKKQTQTALHSGNMD